MVLWGGLRQWKWTQTARRGISSMIQRRTIDYALDDYMDVCKKIRKAEKFRKLITDEPTQCISFDRLESLAKRHGMKRLEAAEFILRYRHVFEVFEHPIYRTFWCRLTKPALFQMQEESEAFAAEEDEAVIRLQKLLMMAAGGRLKLEHVYHCRQELALPEDLESFIISKYPHQFRIVRSDDPYDTAKYIEIVNRNPKLAVCAVEKFRLRAYRQQGKSEDNIRFSFPVNFPPGFKILLPYRLALFKWQKLPYSSPYEDVRHLNLRAFEAKKRLEKRAVAAIHELLSVTVEKKITLEKIANFRDPFNLPHKLKSFLLDYQGIFYLSTRGNYGQLHTVFLREAYRKGELIEPNRLYLARRELMRLILLSPRKVYPEDALEDGCQKHFDDNGKDQQYMPNSYGANTRSPSRAEADSDQNVVNELKLLDDNLLDRHDDAYRNARQSRTN
eukprot:TRINITY_DN3000_c0_g1_i1.p1 TRINITY_DN3000_c0_g1~~TRINITY_DN3000_c0_g1_i1.p1  ORF type:complete len:445 (-),score=77.26 TRINITY_DN3000_c0_g1_i1:153-1487(-)